MRYLYGVLIMSILSLLLFIMSCSLSGPTYFSEELENRPKNELVELIINEEIHDLHIDGKYFNIGREISFRVIPIYLPPGSHIIKYERYVLTDKWLAHKRYMEEHGFLLRRDIKEWQRDNKDGSYTYAPALTTIWGVLDEYEWKEQSMELLGEAGKTYYISKLQ